MSKKHEREKREREAIKENPHAPVTKAAYARWRGVKAPRISVLLRDGRIRETADGKIIPYEADRMLDATTEIQVRAFEPGTNNPVTTQSPGPTSDARNIAELNEDLLLHRTEHEKQKARLAALKADEEEGELIRVEIAERIFFDITRTVRDGIQVLPDKLTPVVMALDDHHSIRMAIAKEVDHILKNLAIDINDRIAFESDG